MKIELGFKPEEFERLLLINDACYTGIERPTLQEFTNMLKHTDVFVVKAQAPYGHPQCGADILIGFAIVRTAGSFGQPYLWSIAVDPEFQGRGVGKNLLREVIKRYTLAKNTEITLHVHPDNPAQILYFNQGFRVQGIAPKWYDKSHGLVMRRPLP